MKGNIVITGGTSGIGLDLCRIFYAMGFQIMAVGKEESKLEALQKMFNRQVFTYQCDLNEPEQIDGLFKRIYTKSHGWQGRCHIFIAGAGFSYYESFDKQSASQWRYKHMEEIFRVNTVSLLYCLSKMNQYSGNQTFRFVPILSGTAKFPLPGYALYSATKAALDAFVNAYRYEKRNDVKISAVYPVAVKTPFYNKKGKNANVPLFRQNREANARAIARGILAGKTCIYPSKLFLPAVLLERVLPFSGLYKQIEAERLKAWLKKQELD